MFDLILYAIPFFVGLLVVEWASFRHAGDGRHRGYETRDTATSLAMGLGNVVINLGWKVAVVAGYAAVYELTPLRIPSGAWWAWVLLFFADDLAYYWFHRASHEVRLFWASHVVHHSSEHYDLSTALRQTWVPMTAFPFWVPLALAGFKPWMIVLQQSISLTYQFFIHTERVGRLPRPVEALLNTPSHHRVHHGSNEIYLDRNYGGILIVWDRLFGSYQRETEAVRYGLTKNIHTHNPARVAFHEYFGIWRDLRRASGWRERFGVMFHGPGWTPPPPSAGPGRPGRTASMRAPVIAAVLASTVVWALSQGHALALPLLSHHGRWLTDPQGRVVILHGVQIDHLDSHGLEQRDLAPTSVRLIGDEGFDLARVSLYFAGVEPQLGHFDDAYADQYVELDHQLGLAGVYDLVDMMQGMYAAEFDGGGFPSWMVITDGAPNVPGPFPQSYLYDPAEERAWDNFWGDAPAADGTGLQDHYAQVLRYLGRDFEHRPAFLGFDLMNEPWPGSQWPSCVNPSGCPVFDAELNAFYRRVIPAMRADERRHLVFYEPHALFDQGADTHLGSIGDPNAVFAFHNYCLGDQPGLPQADPGQDCGIEEQLVLGHAEAQADRAGDGLLEDEWGNTSNTTLIDRMATEADQHMIGWSYWAWEDCCGSPGAVVRVGAKSPTAPGNLNLPVLEALVRPYPKLIAGTPTAWHYDAATRRFTLSYSTRSVAGRSFRPGVDTEVEIPALDYPNGYAVSVAGARVTSAPDANLLRLVSHPGATTVTLAVSPARHHLAGRGPFSWAAGAKAVPADCPARSALAVRVRERPSATRRLRVAIYVDRHRVETVRAHQIRRIRLPSGLADGSTVELKIIGAGERQVVARHLAGCRLRPDRPVTIDGRH